MKDPESKENHWIIDETSAAVVRKIYGMCIAGLAPTKIVKKLKAECVPTPTEYWSSIGRKCANQPFAKYNWSPATVSESLSKQEYCGDTVNFRSTTKSFKNKTKIERAPEEWRYLKTHILLLLTVRPLLLSRNCGNIAAVLQERELSANA